jgi:alginate O-acetyltransferase complex protein AlgI
VAGKSFDMLVGTPDPTLAWLGALCFMAQIYFDFSGYSDMALGLGRMFGFEFHENFAHPYESRSIVEFWRRWHISLSSWFRDYLYIPLGGSRGTPLRNALNLWIVFVLCGLWHGAATNFLVWGIYQGTFLVLERTRLSRWLAAAPAFVAHGYTLLVVLVGWVLFRASDLARATELLGSMAALPRQGLTGIVASLRETVDPLVALALVAAVLFATRAPGAWLARVCGPVLLRPSWAVARDASLAVCFVACMISAAATSFRPFLYFRF